MTKIFVGNLPFTACELDLKRTFEQYGRVSSVRIMTDRTTNRSRGFAFVHMPCLDDADEAIACMSGATLEGRQLTVNESRENRERPRTETGENSARNRALTMFDTLLAE